MTLRTRLAALNTPQDKPTPLWLHGILTVFGLVFLEWVIWWLTASDGPVAHPWLLRIMIGGFWIVSYGALTLATRRQEKRQIAWRLGEPARREARIRAGIERLPAFYATFDEYGNAGVVSFMLGVPVSEVQAVMGNDEV